MNAPTWILADWRLPRDLVGPPAGTPRERLGRVLVVDDDETVAWLAADMLASQHDVVVVHSGVDALDRVRGGEFFAVILCDLMMPRMTGLELHAAIRPICAATARRMVFMSGGYTGDVAAMLVGLPNARIAKPFRARDLRALVGSIAMT